MSDARVKPRVYWMWPGLPERSEVVALMDYLLDARSMGCKAAAAILCIGLGGSVYVPSALAAPQRMQTAGRADFDIQMDVSGALAQSPQLQGQQITAATIQGNVTLSGTVQDEASKQLAQQIAAGVSGVRSVENNLTVSNMSAQQPQMGDQSAEEQVPPPPPYDQGISRPDQADNQQAYPPDQQQPYYQQQPNVPQQPYQQPSYRLSTGPITLPVGTLLNVRTSEPLDARRVQAGTIFQATVANDVFQSGALVIPRGAVLTGQVTGVRKPGDLVGKSGLQLQITSLSLGGQTYALSTDVWTSEGPGKGAFSTANTAGGAAFGATLGAIFGGGPGAAIGAVAGGATGLAASAATRGPKIIIPSESVLNFRLAGPVTVNPVSEREAQQLQASVPQQPELRRRPVFMVPGAVAYPVYYWPGAFYYYPQF
jgi:BON domain